MTGGPDDLLLALARERGLLTEERLQACERALEDLPPQSRPSLFRVAVLENYVPPRYAREMAAAVLNDTMAARLDHCDPVEELGEGPMGSAFVVEHRPTGRRYVLKVFDRSVSADPQWRASFEEKAWLGISHPHPNVVWLLGFGEKLGSLYAISQHVPAAPLARLLAERGRLEVGQALSLGLAAAEALALAERVGMAHGSVSPHNILLGDDGTVRLADLAVAKARPREFSIRKRGVGVRSPAYLSPEHLDRQAAPDIRSDLFSLGAVLFHCLAGEPPFQGETTGEVIFAIENGRHKPLKAVAPEVPQAFASVVEKLLATRPEARYESAAALVADLRAIEQGRVPAAQREAIAIAQQHKQAEAQEAETPARGGRRKWVLAAGGLAAAAALALALAVLWPRKPPDQARTAQPQEPTERQVVDKVKLAREGREAIEQVLKAPEPDQSAPPEERRKALEEKIAKLAALEKKYQGTEAAKLAAERLKPLKAEALFQMAVAYAREHPGQRDELLRRYREVAEKYPDTAAAFKAEQELEKLEGAERKRLLAALAEARRRAAELVAQERFGQALKQFDPLLSQNPTEEIKQMVLQEKIAITSAAERAYDTVHAQAQQKVRAKLYEAAKALYQRVVERFGVEPYVSRARGELAVIEPLLRSAARERLAAIDEAKYQFFLTRLEPSLARLRAWDIKGAAREAQRLRPELKAAGIEAHLDAYLTDVAQLGELKRKVIERLNQADKPVLAKQFSLGKVGGRFDPQWLEARVLSADDSRVVFLYGKVQVERPWEKFTPDELYRLGRLATDIQDPKAHFLLGLHCYYGGLLTTARREFHAAKTAVADSRWYLERLAALGAARAAKPAATAQEKASQLLMEARRFMSERAWDRALYRLAILRAKHASKDYDVSANLAEINERIIECKRHVERMEMEADLALGRRVSLLREALFPLWQRRFGTWKLAGGILAGSNTEDHDAECLVSLKHPPAYELWATFRVVEGTGVLIRLAGKARPSLAFWANAATPQLSGLVYEQATDEQAAKRATRPFTFKPGQWYQLHAIVTPTYVEAAVGENYLVRMAHDLPPSPDGLQTYGFLVNAKSVGEFRELAVRVLTEQ